MPRDGGPFRTGQKVLVPHTDKYYAAKCLKAEKREDNVWYYLVHYQGWNKSFDEWIEQQGLVQFDAELAKVSLSKDEPSKEKPKRAEKKRKPELTPWDGDQQEAAQIHVVLPPLLQKVLLDDRDQILESHELPPFPCRPTVAEVLQSWVRTSSNGKETPHIHEEVAAGLRIYFDKALQQHLLYEEEQVWAEQALAKGTVASCLWGPVHLLRLLCKLPALMPMAGVRDDDRSVLEEQLAAVVAFLKEHHDALFLGQGSLPMAAQKASVLHAGTDSSGLAT